MLFMLDREMTKQLGRRPHLAKAVFFPAELAHERYQAYFAREKTSQTTLEVPLGVFFANAESATM